MTKIRTKYIDRTVYIKVRHIESAVAADRTITWFLGSFFNLAQNSPQLGCGDECATKGCQGVGSFPRAEPEPLKRGSARFSK